ncbi:MAG: hypothetical protein WC341_08700 [Bacteroidales bacterium]|jgi:hypothetical protein
MKTKSYKLSLKFRIAIPLLAFTFFWLVIGDLVTYHQKAIYGFDLFNFQTPFTKPTKTDNGLLILKTKNGKVAHGDAFSISLHILFADDYSIELVDFAKNVTVTFDYLSIYQQRFLYSGTLRGPPAV